jgi:hypothetical protein
LGPAQHPPRAAVFLAAHPRDFVVAYLPAYAPELNPEEQCNACVKRAMANALLGSVADLHHLARREFQRLQHRPELIVGCFCTSGCRLCDFREGHQIALDQSAGTKRKPSPQRAT